MLGVLEVESLVKQLKVMRTAKRQSTSAVLSELAIKHRNDVRGLV